MAFTFDQHGAPQLEEQLNYLDSHGKGVLNEFLEVQLQTRIILVFNYMYTINSFRINM